MTKSRTPVYKRKPQDVPFNFTDRDFQILIELNNYRYLNTSQIKGLVFPDNTTLQGTRRRLSKLYHHKYIERISPYVQVGKPQPEVAYCLAKLGMSILNEHDIPCKIGSKIGKVKHQFLQHALDISTFRIQLTESLVNDDVVNLAEFIPDFEVKLQTQNLVGRRRYKLFDEVTYKTARKTFFVYPDALIILSAQLEQGEKKALYFLEIDRGTEGLNVIQEKITGYRLYLEQRIFKKYGDFDTFRVLIQTTSKKRADNIRHTLFDHKGGDLVWVTHHEKIATCESLTRSPVWQDVEGNEKAILKWRWILFLYFLPLLVDS